MPHTVPHRRAAVKQMWGEWMNVTVDSGRRAH
jgi:hypothetical protein